MASLPESESHLHYQPLSNGVHVLEFLDSSEVAIDECFVILDQIILAAPLNQTLLLLTDLRKSGAPSVYLVINLASHLMTKHRRRPRIANAIVYTGMGARTTFAGVMARLAFLYGARVRFFYEFDEAVKWLLSEG